MKKLLLLCLAGSLAAAAMAQTPVSYDYKDKKVILPAAIKELTKEDRYTIVMPGRLSYFSSTEEIRRDIWNPALSLIEIKARVHDIKADYRFSIVTPGVQKIALQGVRWFKTEVPDANQIPREVKGYVRDYTCTFPCKLVVTNPKGEVLNTIVISDDSTRYTVTLHRDFLQPDNQGTYLKPVIPMASAEQITTLESSYANMINKKIEQIIGYQIFWKVSSTLTLLYKNYNTGKQTYGYGFVKAKNGPSTVPEIDKVVEDYKRALDSLSAGSFTECARICEANMQVMEGLLASTDSRIDKNVKEILYYNLSHANLLTNHFDAAWKYYNLFLQSGVEPGTRLATELRGRISEFQLYEGLKEQAKKAGAATP